MRMLAGAVVVATVATASTVIVVNNRIQACDNAWYEFVTTPKGSGWDPILEEPWCFSRILGG